jgi:predicted metal-dependent peptidase
MRPERISKMISFLRNREPLLYLFLLNANYEEVNQPNFYMAVGIKNGITLYYSQQALELPVQSFFFALVHEAKHIFYQHLHVFEKLLTPTSEKDKHLLANIATDAIINEDIINYNFEYFKEITKERVYFENCVRVEPKYYDFLNSKNIAKEDGLSSLQYYQWLKENGYSAKYGQNQTIIVLVDKKGNEKESRSIDGSPPPNSQDEKEDGEKEDGEKEEASQSSQKGENGEVPQYIKDMLERMVRQAEKMEAAEKNCGTGSGSMATDLRLKMKKSKVNWRTELRKKMNFYVSKNGVKPEKKKSFLTYMMNPKSNDKMLFPHTIKQRSRLQTAIILAIDTSGSCFCSEEELENFFTEIESISKELEKSKKGRVYTMMWDCSVHGEIKEYKVGDYKTFRMKGGGGTEPKCIFDFIDKNCLKQDDNNAIIKLQNGDLNIELENLKALPLVVVLTDGYFYNFKKTGIYKDSKNVLFFTRTADNIKDDTEYILYS